MAPLSFKQWVLSHVLLILLLALSLQPFFQLQKAHASLSILDVGQGDSLLLQTEEGKNILIDAGPDGRVVERLSEKLNFFNQTIDLFILSHPHWDHYGGILDVLQKYPVKAIMLTGITSGDPAYLDFIKTAKEKDIPIIYPSSDHDLQIAPDLYVDFLYPFEGMSLMGMEAKNKNNNSVSLRLVDAQGKGLVTLTGDAEVEQETELLLSGQDLSAEILKLGHHGSKTSSTSHFLKAVGAHHFAISVGTDNTFGHPNQEVLDRLAGQDVRRTDQEGTIEFMLK